MPRLRTESNLGLERQPFIYISAAFAAGILVDRLTAPAVWIPILLTIGFLAASAVFVRRKKSGAATALLLSAFCAAGILTSTVERRSITTDRLAALYGRQKILPDDPVELTGTLTRPPEPIPEGYLIDVAAERVVSRHQEYASSGKARLMLSLPDDLRRDEFAALNLDYGSRVRILIRLSRAQTYSNPGSIDFNEFLEHRGYDLNGSIKSPLLIEPLERTRANPLLGALYRFRIRVFRSIDAHFRPPVSGTLKAMLIGNRYYLDPVTVRRLREGGAFHMLVIAGLHVGIIAWLLLGFGPAASRRRAVRVIPALAVLWAYAVMVGMAPPVTRSTLIITIGLIGPMLFRRSVSLNSLALAAFVMLAAGPLVITDAGFQLSFAAVFGIVALAVPLCGKLDQIGNWRPSAHSPHPPHCSAWLRSFAETLMWSEREFTRGNLRAPVRYSMDKSAFARVVDRWRMQWLLRYIAFLVITSAVIQLATLPLMIFYFNRLSPVGLVINIAAGLLTGILMIGGAVTLAAGPLSGTLASILARAMTEIHYFLVNSIAPFIHIPGATFRVAQYNGPRAAVYFIYFVPLALLAIALDRWRPVDEMFEVERSPGRPDNTRKVSRKSLPGGLRPHDASPKRPLTTILLARMLTGLQKSVSGPRLALVAFGMLAICIFVSMRPLGPAKPGALRINFLDVGQGDSALVTFPHGATMLIDGGGEIHIGTDSKDRHKGLTAIPEIENGPKSNLNDSDTTDEPDTEADFNDTGLTIGEAVVARFLWSLGLSHLDYVLATHAHEDHTGGLSDVFRDFKVGELIVGHSPPSDGTFRRLRRSAARAGIPIGSVSQGESFELDGVKIRVLWPQPPQTDANARVTSGNNDSVVLLLTYGSVNIMMTGDIESPAEQSLAESGVDLHADLLKAPHHGSKTSSTDAFLDRVQPKYAVISVGVRSRFGHPNKEVVDRYNERGIKLYWTGRDGTVTATTDGASLSVSNYLVK